MNYGKERYNQILTTGHFKVKMSIYKTFQTGHFNSQTKKNILVLKLSSFTSTKFCSKNVLPGCFILEVKISVITVYVNYYGILE